LNFEACPGEQRCETKEGNRIYRFLQRNPAQEIEQICAGCSLKETKPGMEPAQIARAIWIANELEEDSLVCGSFDYPAILDYLDPFEWVCLVAIKAARRASENKATKTPREQADKEAQYQHLKQMSLGK
jgi:hypothetical protein